MGAPYSKNCFGLPEKNFLSLVNLEKWWGLPKTSNIDLSTTKTLGAPSRNDGAFLKSNNNTALNYKNVGGSPKKSLGLPANKSFDSCEAREMAGAP